MTAFSRTDELRGATFQEVDLRGANFREVDLREARLQDADLSRTVMRGVEVQDLEIEAPWLFDGDHYLQVNGVDVRPYVDAELNKRFPGREHRQTDTPEGLRAAWESVQRAWAKAVDRAAAMPTGTVEESVDDEWSFAQTLRHLIMATDVWLGRAILRKEQPYHSIGQPNDDDDTAAYDLSVFAKEAPSYDEVLEVRAGRVAMVRNFLADLTPETLAEQRNNPHAPQYDETVLSCLHTILEEEWEHLRFAIRDLDALERRAAGPEVG